MVIRLYLNCQDSHVLSVTQSLVVKTFASEQKLKVSKEFACCLHVYGFSGYASFLPQSKNMHVKAGWNAPRCQCDEWCVFPVFIYSPTLSYVHWRYTPETPPMTLLGTKWIRC